GPLKCRGNRFGVAGKRGIMRQAGKHKGKEHVQYCTDNQGPNYTNGHTFLRIFRLLCGGTYRVKANKCKKHHTGSTHDAANPEFAKVIAFKEVKESHLAG